MRSEKSRNESRIEGEDVSVSPKVEMRESALGERGLFAREKFLQNELVADFSKAPGKIISAEEADELYRNGGKFSHYIFQVDDDKFKAATREEELGAAYFFNHSCDPSCALEGAWRIVAIRDINSGEELTFDYAMSESADFEIECHCGSKKCRKIITGNDWKIEELQQRYKGHFSDYLQAKIENNKRVKRR